ncbi:MAG TPA: FGGY family carbohydrate kinase, partial [Rubrobacteraceae bacterium]|nr:FGGY family carbohydrate kinase [Rubrobacteraceae bacterium]
DADGQEIWAVPNMDARASEEAEELIADRLAEPIYRRGGDWTSISAASRLRWIKNHMPEVWERASKMTMLGDWVLQKLSGEFVTDPSLGSSSGLFDLSSRSWSQETAEELGISEILPQVVESGAVVGGLTQRAAEETGLREGTPVVAGGGDTQLALLGAGAVDPNSFGVVGGTFWLTAGIKDEPLTDPEIRLRTLCHVVPDRWMIEGVGFLHGFSTRWARDELYRAANPDVPPGEGYKKLNELAEQYPPGANGVFYFCSNVMDAKEWKHGPPAIVGLNPLEVGQTSLGAVFRAIMEEAAYVSRGHLEILEEVFDQRVDRVDFVGGPSQSRLWSQVLADVLGIPVRVPAVGEATGLGAALCALVGTGTFANLAEAARATIETGREYEPDEDAKEAYTDLYPRWRALNDYLLEAAERGLASNLWRGAGA